MNNDLPYLLALHAIDGIGGVTARSLISYCGSAEAVFQASEAKLMRIPLIGEHTAKLIRQQEGFLARAEREIALVEKAKAEIIPFSSPAYPTRLARLHDAPLLLYHKGNTKLNAPYTVAIVGTREATDYGKSITEEIVAGLKPYNVLVVSGLAYGIDIAAHRACLQHDVATLGVMANGLKMVYPSQHAKIAEEMQQLGGLLTENTMETKPDSGRFPARNRIIAGMADVVIVVEAKIKGGALITANIANEYSKEVFAVPNNIRSVHSAGCNELIRRQQAHLYTQVSDVTTLMQWFADGTPQRTRQASFSFDEGELEESQQKILAYLQQTQEAFLDDMAFRLDMPVGQVSADLLSMELSGLVRVLPGKKYVLA